MESTPNSSYPQYASVLLEIAIDKPLEYGVSEEHVSQIVRGVQVKVPVRGKLQTGYVLELKKEPSFPKVLPIGEVVSEQELISEDLFTLAIWMSRYYATPLRRVMKSLLPASIRKNVSHKNQYFVSSLQTKEHLRNLYRELSQTHLSQAKVLEILLPASKGMLLSELLEKGGVSKSPVDTLVKKGVLHLQKIQIDRSPLSGEEYFKTKPKPLHKEQKEAFDKICSSLTKREFETHLLYGITGSGKTEVYLQAIEYALQLDLSAILLVPEIALTAQTIERFRSRFDDKIAVLHYRLSPGERFDEWHRIRKGEAKIVIGARSAIFSPVPNLGLILVDEEHDGAYKQTEEAPCYHARDVAVMRGKLSSSTVVLGTATPSMETYHNVMRGKYTLSTLHERATSSSLPHVTIVDMKREFEKAKGYTSFSEILLSSIQKRVERGEQTILFLNRRGYHTSFSCTACGHIYQCPHCDLPLTFHKGEGILSCHLCGYRISPLPRVCGSCQSGEMLKFKGVGTEQIEKSLHAIFPSIRTIRVDGDTTRHKGSHERLFREFRTGKADLLIGTQMVTKGLHFPGVTLVAILNTDGSLHIPDFRAGERVFQLATQVAGRAGRGTVPGEVILQTQIPENGTIKQAAAQDFDVFYQSEIKIRKAFGFPPFTHLIKVTLSSKKPSEIEIYGQRLREKIATLLGNSYLVHPLIPCGYAKIKDWYRCQFLIRGVAVYPMSEGIQKVLSEFSPSKTLRVQIDVDPLSTFF
ncbi:MAG: Primosomal protein N' [Chlamydiae bacterium]|nr:Primosomal protein N' [Chlamydiota bacterium]